MENLLHEHLKNATLGLMSRLRIKKDGGPTGLQTPVSGDWRFRAFTFSAILAFSFILNQDDSKYLDVCLPNRW